MPNMHYKEIILELKFLWKRSWIVIAWWRCTRIWQLRRNYVC